MIEIIVPATTANLGPGFDCLGLALQLRNKIVIEESGQELEVICGDEQEKYIEKDKTNLIYQSIKKIFDRVGKKMPGIRMMLTNEIPVCRGLGSSAACITAGCVAGNILSGAGFSNDELIAIATEIEGHPDNVVPAFVGGFTVSCMDNGKVIYTSVNAYNSLKFAVMYPDFMLPTSIARKVVPQTLGLKDSVYNIGRASLLTAALMSDKHELLKFACQDKLHQPYRKELIPGFDHITSKALELGAYATFLSGAGPTIIAVLDKSNNEFEKMMQDELFVLSGNWAIKIIEMDCRGVSYKVV